MCFRHAFFSEEIGHQEDNKRKKAENKAIAINIAVGITIKFFMSLLPLFTSYKETNLFSFGTFVHKQTHFD